MSDIEKENKGRGHRKRLRERFINSGLTGFLDYEIVELLLTLGTPRKDYKEMAKELFKKYKGLTEVLDADFSELQKIKGIGPMNAFGIKLFQAMAERYAKEKISQKTKINSPAEAAGYLQKKIGREKKEHFVALYLDTRHQLIHEEIISVGTLNASLVHPREVFKTAVDKLAVGIIVAHNHPSGDPLPSQADIDLTKRLIEAGKLMGINLIDSLIVTNNDFKSIL